MAKQLISLRILAATLCLLILAGSSPPVSRAEGGIAWSQEELDFMAEHPQINLGVDPAFIPYEFFDTDGVYKGIAADYVALISKATGLRFVATEGLTWAQAYEKAVRGELDALPCVSKTEGREKYFLFSQGYFTFQRVIFINENNKQIKSFDDLKGMRVAVQANSSNHSFLMDYPEISLGLYPTTEEALQAVSDGSEMAFVGNLSSSGYLSRKYGITNLRYITIYSQEPQQLYFAARRDWPVLVGIIDKALGSIPQEEKIAISNKWISIQPSTDISALVRTLLVIGGLAGLVMTVSLFWIIRLRKEVAIRKEAQEEMNQAKIEAEAANQVKSLFLARMSHEIRTPLSAIMGMSYLIKKTGLTATQSDYLEKSNQAAHGMLSIINDILDFSKIESGSVEIEKTSFDLDKLLQRIANIVSVKASEKGIEFFIRKQPDMPALFLGDPARIEQILLNLVNNAVKFTQHGSVTLSIAPLSYEEVTQVILFRIEDTGIGMSEEQLKRLFTPFDQGDASISRRFGGTGLGLSIVKNLTELMGGQIQVISEADKGSIFTVQLPLETDNSQDQTESRKMAADCFSSVHALVLDASESSRSMLGDYLKAFGIDHRLTKDESEAIQIMRDVTVAGQVPINLLLVDYMTPRDGGIAFLASIRKAMYFHPSCKCLLMVPMTREEVLEEGVAGGIDYGLTKPVIPSALYNGIMDLFRIKPPTLSEARMPDQSLQSPFPYRILLVEDNKTNQFIAQSILQAAGFSVFMADNGKEGVDRFQDNCGETDLILMDIHMPVMDGYTAADLIRQADADIPIIAMTADAVLGAQEKCRSHGINYYVSKPFEPEAFIRVILEALKGKLPRARSISCPTDATAPAAVAGPFSISGEPAKLPAADDGPALESAKAIRDLGIDEKLYSSIVREYLKENEETGQTLQQQLDASNFSQAALTVHKIKSSSGSIGARKLADCAARLQKALQAGEGEAAREESARFQQLLSETLGEIRARLSWDASRT
ncbi:MAG: transporter substrate-binding domain-containing protein [Christensenellales bacterium]